MSAGPTKVSGSSPRLPPLQPARTRPTSLRTAPARLQWELYRRFRNLAPTREKIDQDAAALGFRIRRATGDDGKRLSVKRELARRRRSIGWLSVSFLQRQWRAKRGRSIGRLRRCLKAQAGDWTRHHSHRQRRVPPRVCASSVFSKGPPRAESPAGGSWTAPSVPKPNDMRTHVARKQREQAQRDLSGTFKHLIGP